MPHVGDLLVELLARYGVTDIFGQPGGQTAALYDGVARRPGRVRHTLVRDERSAAYAADAFARLTGRPGVCDVTVGPGTTKLTDGLVESYNASVPVIALVGDLPRDWAPYRERGVASQGFGQVALLSAITKSTLEVPSPAALPQLVRAAFRIATSGRPGPVALVIPHDVLDADWEPTDAALQIDDRYRRAPAYRPVPEPGSLADAAALLRASRRPVIVAGGGVHASRAAEQLTRLAEILGAVVVTSFSGKGAVAETAPYAAGVLNPLGSLASLELARQADLSVWCGCKLGQNTSHNWTLPAPGQATIHIDADPAELGRTFRPTVALQGDAAAALAALAEILERDAPAPSGDWAAEAARVIEQARLDRAAEEASDAVPVRPQRVMRELAARLDAESYGGAVLLGLGGTVVIAHGASTARAVTSACVLAADLARGQLTDKITQRLSPGRPSRGGHFLRRPLGPAPAARGAALGWVAIPDTLKAWPIHSRSSHSGCTTPSSRRSARSTAMPTR